MSKVRQLDRPRRSARLSVAAAAYLIMLAGLPVALWNDIGLVNDSALHQSAVSVNTVFETVRSFYTQSVIARIQAASGQAMPVHNFRNVAGGIPIPATMAIEVSAEIGDKYDKLKYRFVSDLPFRKRPPLDEFEIRALKSLRANPDTPVVEFAGKAFDRSIRFATAVRMAQGCVNCHNAHPDSPKKDWKVGEVRGIQEVILKQPLEHEIFAFRTILAYLGFMLAAGLGLFFWVRGRTAAS